MLARTPSGRSANDAATSVSSSSSVRRRRPRRAGRRGVGTALLERVDLVAGGHQRRELVGPGPGHLVQAPHGDGGPAQRMHGGGIVTPARLLQLADQGLARR